jgi:zinc/manganese transport system substrate-binding protein
VTTPRAAATARACLAVLAPALALALGACNRAGGPSSAGARASGAARFTVVAAENTWGSIARQLAGDRARVSSIIANPNSDPHTYEPNARDARAIAGAQLVIVNGLGYDSWAGRLLRTGATPDRMVLDVSKAVGAGSGSNPHLWYSPSVVHEVVDRIAASYERLDPADRAYFEHRRRDVQTRALARYDELIGALRAAYAGVPVGYSESIFQPLGTSLGLRLMTPAGFAKAVAEGTDVTAQDKRTVDAQAAAHRIKLWVYNRQNVTPDVQRVNELARAQGIPVVTVTETLSPAGATFGAWQVAQLESLRAALRRATGS